MNGRSQCCFALSFGLVLSWGSVGLSRAQESEAPLKVAVRTYNYAAVPGKTLADAEQHAEEIFRRPGIELAWIECPRSPREVEKFPACTQIANDPRALTLKILTEAMAAGYALPVSNLGVTIQHHASFVFYSRVQQLSNTKGLSESVVLAHIIAHELGHLVLGSCLRSEPH